jgi:hypothetical protein
MLVVLKMSDSPLGASLDCPSTHHLCSVHLTSYATLLLSSAARLARRPAGLVVFARRKEPPFPILATPPPCHSVPPSDNKVRI